MVGTEEGEPLVGRLKENKVGALQSEANTCAWLWRRLVLQRNLWTTCFRGWAPYVDLFLCPFPIPRPSFWKYSLAQAHFSELSIYRAYSSPKSPSYNELAGGPQSSFYLLTVYALHTWIMPFLCGKETKQLPAISLLCSIGPKLRKTEQSSNSQSVVLTMPVKFVQHILPPAEHWHWELYAGCASSNVTPKLICTTSSGRKGNLFKYIGLSYNCEWRNKEVNKNHIGRCCIKIPGKL